MSQPILEKPLFVPLMTVYYEAFAAGIKTDELRLYGARYNEKTCRIGREIILSKGYGKNNRLKGRISSFSRQDGSTLEGNDKRDVLAVYGTLEEDIARIGVTDIEVISQKPPRRISK